MRTILTACFCIVLFGCDGPKPLQKETFVEADAGPAEFCRDLAATLSDNTTWCKAYGQAQDGASTGPTIGDWDDSELGDMQKLEVDGCAIVCNMIVQCDGPNYDPKPPCKTPDGNDLCIQDAECPKNGLGESCGDDSHCQNGNCVDGVCCATECAGTCQACNVEGSVGSCTFIPNTEDPEDECPTGTCNGAGECTPSLGGNGSTCTTHTSCTSGFCVDGVCCNSTCAGTCMACDVPGSVGTCWFEPAGSETGDECSGSATCNGAGACTGPTGTVCGNGTCQSGETCSSCSVDCGTCPTGCTTDADCNDMDPTTQDRCNAANVCVYTVSGAYPFDVICNAGTTVTKIWFWPTTGAGFISEVTVTSAGGTWSSPAGAGSATLEYPGRWDSWTATPRTFPTGAPTTCKARLSFYGDGRLTDPYYLSVGEAPWGWAHNDGSRHTP